MGSKCFNLEKQRVRGFDLLRRVGSVNVGYFAFLAIVPQVNRQTAARREASSESTVISQFSNNALNR